MKTSALWAFAVFGATLMASGASGCAATPSPDEALPPAPSYTPAGAMFVKKVYPELQLTCAFCHAAAKNPVGAPQFMSFAAPEAYERVVAHPGLVTWPTDSLLLLKGEHTGPALTKPQRELITEWLELEAKERGFEPETEPTPDPNAPAKTVDEALAQFGDCMRYEDFVASKVGLLAYQQTTGWGPCRGCHSTGWGGAFIDDDAKLMFEQTRKTPFLLKFVGWTSKDGGFQDLVAADRMRDKGVEPCTYTGDDEVLCHPKYVLLPEVDASLDAFFQATYERWKATKGKCNDGPSDGSGGAGGGP